jgi:thiol-disulfide isomerase/thioredoxin
MKFIIFTLYALIPIVSRSQSIDSAWIEKNVLSRFTKDSTSVLPSLQLIDEKGNKKLRSDYKGKTIYIDVWSTSCAPCIAQFPYQKQLLGRLKTLHLDTSIIFLNINIEDSKAAWKKALKKYQPAGINLYCSDTTLYDDWKINALPCHILLNSSGFVVGKYIAGPHEAGIDWLLYCTFRNISPRDATWREFRQRKLMEKYRSVSAFTDPEYKTWFEKMLPAFIEFDK